MEKKKPQVHIIAIPKEHQKETDEYGLKKMLSNVIKKYTCPKCQKIKGKIGFFVWVDEAKGLAKCHECGFEKTFKVKK
jgi:transcription elongation factor Elf1